MANVFVFQSNNSSGILYDSSQSLVGPYISGVPGAEVMCPDNFDEFFQYSTKEECLQKALALDPSYSKNNIYGKINLELIDSSPETIAQEAGTELILFCEFSTPEAGVTVTYQWFDPQGMAIPTATSNVFSFTPSSTQFAGEYRCQASASGDYNWTGGDSFVCTVNIAPKPLF